MSHLLSIGLRHGTDKADAHHTHMGVSYLDVYARYFQLWTTGVTRVLEIGVLNGASLRTWKEYFPNATIYGVDINPECEKHEEDRIKIFTGSQADPVFLQAVAEDAGGFDIVVDDGSHVVEHMLISMGALWGRTRKFYCIEDTGCTYFPAGKDWPGMHLNDEIPLNVREDFEKVFLNKIRKLDHGDGGLQAVHFHNMQVIFEK